jgi:hypothetical protein
MAGSKAALRMADRLAGGKLADEIARYRKVKAPWPSIADYLNEEYGVEVTGDTLSNWARELGVGDATQDEAVS